MQSHRLGVERNAMNNACGNKGSLFPSGALWTSLFIRCCLNFSILDASVSDTKSWLCSRLPQRQARGNICPPVFLSAVLRNQVKSVSLAQVIIIDAHWSSLAELKVFAKSLCKSRVKVTAPGAPPALFSTVEDNSFCKYFNSLPLRCGVLDSISERRPLGSSSNPIFL